MEIPKVGSRVEFQNLVGTIVGRDGNALLFRPNGSSEKIQVLPSQVTVIMNEGHLESARMEDYRNMLND